MVIPTLPQVKSHLFDVHTWRCTHFWVLILTIHLIRLNSVWLTPVKACFTHNQASLPQQSW